MKYPATLLRFMNETWAIDRPKLADMVDFLLFKAEGGMLTDPEVEARTISGKREREVAASPGEIGFIPVHGLIMPRVANLRVSEPGIGLDALAQQFRAAIANENVKAIVMEYDTPGGQTGGLDELAQEMFEARGTKPIIAQINSLAASAGYYLAAQADEVIASPSSRAGSIGVYSIHDDVSAQLEAKGIKRTIIASGPNKVSANPFGPLTEEGREKIAAAVNYANDQFVRAVARGRNVTVKFVNQNMGAGDSFDPPDLLKRNMVDRIAPLRETLARFGVNLSPGKAAAARSARTALALGRKPDRTELEALFRECGASKTLAASLASGGAADRGRSESGGDYPNRSESGGETGDNEKQLESIRAMRSAFRSAFE